MIDRILIMNPSGATYFSWTTDPAKADPTLISGFLTALNMFAGNQQGEELKEITLNKTTYIFERTENLVVVILTQDPEFEKVIRLLLPVVLESFRQRYYELITTFSGDIAPFQAFKIELEDILTSYGYFNYLEVTPQFESEESIECVMYLDNETGEVLYIKSKKYLDRDLFGFQTMVLIKSLIRALENKLKDKLELILILTDRGRNIEIKNYEKLSIVYESKNEMSDSDITKKEEQTKWKKILKNIQHFLTPFPNPILIFDKSGENNIIHDTLGIPQFRNMSADLVTTQASVENILNSVYKEKSIGILIMGTKNVCLLHQDEPYIIFSVFNYSTCPLLFENKDSLMSFKINLAQNIELKDGIYEFLTNYKRKFSY